jgi:hypothetical protein
MKLYAPRCAGVSQSHAFQAWSITHYRALSGTSGSIPAVKQTRSSEQYLAVSGMTILRARIILVSYKIAMSNFDRTSEHYRTDTIIGPGYKERASSFRQDVREWHMRQRIMWVLLLCLGGATCASAQTANIIPPIEGIIAGMVLARAVNQARFRSYIVTRDYILFGKERAKIKFHVIADISFVPPTTKKYTIQKAIGASFGETVVRRMLKSEVEIAKDYASTDFSPDNYDFRFILEESVGGQRCYLLELIPKRKDRNLLRGKIWVDAGTYLPQHIEGEPAKTPSWWLRRLHIELSFGEVGGMWLQTALEATATVRILGPQTMISRDVKYQMDDLVVAAQLQP